MACWCSLSLSLEYLSLFELEAVLEGSCLFVCAHIISQRFITGCVFDAGCKLRLSQITYQEGTSARDCNSRNCARSLNRTGWDAEISPMYACTTIPDQLVFGELSWHVRVQDNNLCYSVYPFSSFSLFFIEVYRFLFLFFDDWRLKSCFNGARG